MSTLFTLWTSMIHRCHDESDKSFRRYGGRGIVVCERWRDSFEDFLADMGPRPEGKSAAGRSLWSVDRYPNRNGNYEPGNVRWATNRQQRENMDPERAIAVLSTDGLSPAQARCAKAILDLSGDPRGQSLRALADRLGYASTNGVGELIQKMLAKGAIRIDWRTT